MVKRIPIAPAPQTPEQQRPHIDMPDTTLPPGSTFVPKKGPPQVPITAEGTAKAAATGVRVGAESGVGIAGDIPDLAGRLGRWASEKIGIGDPEAVGGAVSGAAETVISPAVKLIRAMEMAGIIDHDTAEQIISVQVPSSQDVGAATDWTVKQLPESVSGPIQDITRHQAGNPLERFAETSGTMAGTAFLPGGAIARTTRPFVAGGAVEAAGGAVPKEYEDAARIVAGILVTGGVTKGQQNFRTNSAFRRIASSPEATDRVVQLLRESGMSPEEAAAKVAEHPNLRTYNVSTNLQQEAQKLYAKGGEARGIIDPIARAQEEAINRHLMEDVGAAVGPYKERGTVLQALEKRAQEKGAEQKVTARTQEVQPADPQGIVDDLDAMLGESGRSDSIRSALKQVRDSLFLREKGKLTDQLDTSSAGLLRARQTLKDMLYTEEGIPKKGGIVDVVKDFYGKINEAIDPSNPALRKTDAEIAAIAKEREAFEKGETVYEKGREVQGPVGFAQEWGGLPAAEKQALVEGIGAETWRRLGQQGNDLVELKRMMVGEGKWPVDKLTTAIGPEKTQALLDALEHGGTVQEGTRKILHGSKTAETQTEKGPPTIGRAAVEAAPDVIAAQLVDPMGMAGTMVGLGKLRSFIQQRLAARSQTARASKLDAEIARLAMGRGDDLVRAAKLLQQSERQTIFPQAALTGLLSRQEDLARKKESQK